jgi:hypothetical protein
VNSSLHFSLSLILLENVFKWVLNSTRGAVLYVVTGTWYDPKAPVQKLPGGVGIPNTFYKVFFSFFLFIRIKLFFFVLL